MTTKNELYTAITKVGVLGAVNAGLINSGDGEGSTFENVATATEYSVDFSQVKNNSAMVVTNKLEASGPSTAVIPTRVTETLATTENNGPGHLIGDFNKMTIEADVETAFGTEYRLDATTGNITGTYTAVKHVIGPDSQNGGDVENYCIERFDDMRDSVSKVATITQDFLDPRIVTTHNGGNLKPSDQITSSVTLSNRDSDKDFIVVSNSDVTITIGAGCTNGFKATFLQGSTGKITIAVDAGKAFYSRGNQTTTNGLLSSVSVIVYPYSATLGKFDDV